MEKDAKTSGGFVALSILAAKLGPKFIAIAVKMKAALFSAAKSLSGVKAAGIAASVGMYTYLFTWQMGVALVVFIGIHEYGHIWAMRHKGIGVQGMYFIPGFGAVAIPKEAFGGASKEAFVALMGPIWGIFLFVVPMIMLWIKTGNDLWAAIASLTTFVNMVNLLPINPLDGGRVVKALAYSDNQARSLGISVGITVITALVASIAGLELVTYMAIIGFYEIASEFGIKEHVASLLRTLTRIGLTSIFLIISYYVIGSKPVCEYLNICRVHAPELSWVWGILSILFIISFCGLVTYDIMRNEKRILYPLRVLSDAYKGIKELFSLRAAHIKPIKDYPKMSGRQKLSYALSFAGLIVLHISVLVWLSQTPTAAIGRELLK